MRKRVIYWNYFIIWGLAGRRSLTISTLFVELTDGGVDLLTCEVVDGEILAFPIFPVRTYRERGDEPFLGAIAPVRSHANAVPVALRGRIDEERTCRWRHWPLRRPRKRPGLNDGGTALLDGRNEIT